MNVVTVIRRLLATISLLCAPAALSAEMIGEDAALCQDRRGPAVQVNILGLKDRAGEIWLELYPATETDFLRPDQDLVAEGKTFRRTRARPISLEPTAICIRVPRPGRFALTLRHNRTGKDKFSLWSDGIGFPGNQQIGRSRPTLSQAVINVGSGITITNIRLQYLRGLRGFAPLER